MMRLRSSARRHPSPRRAIPAWQKQPREQLRPPGSQPARQPAPLLEPAACGRPAAEPTARTASSASAQREREARASGQVTCPWATHAHRATSPALSRAVPRCSTCAVGGAWCTHPHTTPSWLATAIPRRPCPSAAPSAARAPSSSAAPIWPRRPSAARLRSALALAPPWESCVHWAGAHQPGGCAACCRGPWSCLACPTMFTLLHSTCLLLSHPLRRCPCLSAYKSTSRHRPSAIGHPPSALRHPVPRRLAPLSLTWPCTFSAPRMCTHPLPLCWRFCSAALPRPQALCSPLIACWRLCLRPSQLHRVSGVSHPVAPCAPRQLQQLQC